MSSPSAAVTLLYHQVAPTTPAEDPLGLAVTPVAFEAQMGLLREVGIAVGAAAPGAVDHSIAITFDDGYLDAYERAFPILQRHCFAATIFVVTRRVGGRRDWDRSAPVPLMSWHHIRELSRHGVSFQSHSATHPDLTACDDRRAREELLASRHELEDRVGVAVDAIAYPYGRFDARVLRLTAEAGYRSGWAAGFSNAGILALERFQVTSRDTGWRFALKARGWASWLRRLRHGAPSCPDVHPRLPGAA